MIIDAWTSAGDKEDIMWGAHWSDLHEGKRADVICVVDNAAD
jgi:hypothetical protein